METIELTGSNEAYKVQVVKSGFSYVLRVSDPSVSIGFFVPVNEIKRLHNFISNNI